jgi:hypothetical protein
MEEKQALRCSVIVTWSLPLSNITTVNVCIWYKTCDLSTYTALQESSWKTMWHVFCWTWFVCRGHFFIVSVPSFVSSVFIIIPSYCVYLGFIFNWDPRFLLHIWNHLFTTLLCFLYGFILLVSAWAFIPSSTICYRPTLPRGSFNNPFRCAI